MSADPHIVRNLLDARRYGALRVAYGKALHLCYRLFMEKRYRRPVLERIEDVSLLVLPGILNPRLTRTGAFFCSQLSRDLITAHAEVLDMGTGSGACAVFAARYARHVVAVDINAAAVRCARINALANRADDKIEVLHGDLFEPLAGRRFDVVLFNPPFLRGVPKDDADRAWRSTDVAERFAAGLREHLHPEGFALVLLSTYGDPAHFIGQFHARGFAMQVLAQRRFVNEKLILLKLS